MVSSGRSKREPSRWHRRTRASRVRRRLGSPESPKRPRTQDPKSKVKIAAYISLESARRLGIHATMTDQDKSTIIDGLIREHLRDWVVQYRPKRRHQVRRRPRDRHRGGNRLTSGAGGEQGLSRCLPNSPLNSRNRPETVFSPDRQSQRTGAGDRPSWSQCAATPRAADATVVMALTLGP